MQEKTQIFTPENIKEMVGRRILIDAGGNPHCYTIEEVSEMGEAAFVKPEDETVLDGGWVVLEWLNRWFLDFVAAKKQEPPTTSEHKWVTDMETGRTKYQFKMEWKTAEDVEQEPPKSDAKKSNWEPSR